MKNIIIFATGEGSNAANIMAHFSSHPAAKVVAVFCNNPNGGVIRKSVSYGIPVVLFTRIELSEGTVLHKLRSFNPHLIVLAGFLWKLPIDVIEAFPRKIINIHPALLPNYGGQGMYGMHVHRSVLENKEKQTGITIHYVDENYDSGDVIFQQGISIAECTTADEISDKVRKLEHKYFPRIIENLLSSAN